MPATLAWQWKMNSHTSCPQRINLYTFYGEKFGRKNFILYILLNIQLYAKKLILRYVREDKLHATFTAVLLVTENIGNSPAIGQKGNG